MLCTATLLWLTPAHISEARRLGRIGDVTRSTIEGSARVVDGDTLVVAGQRIRLEGIDAPEIKQLCQRPGRSSLAGKAWPAGLVAVAAMRRWVRDRTVRCRVAGRGSYGRRLARCRAGGIDLNAEMVRQGLAWAFLKYSQTFAIEERSARAAQVGVWSAACQPAWIYRASRWRDVAGRAPRGCPIKGNVSRNGRIYHMPWSRWYGRTRIETHKGDRWFCDEAEAIRAGWRPATVR